MSQMQAAGSASSSSSIADGVSSSIKATVLDLTDSNPLTVAITDANGDQITSFGGGTQYTEDAAAAANPVGTAVNLVRQDTPSALVTTDGDNVTQRGTNYGAAYAQIVTSAGAFVDTFGGGTQFADGAARSTATGTIAMVDDGTNIQSMKGDASGRPLVTIDTALPAGTALIGKAGIDQTTPGTTNAVSIAQLGANTIATGNGVSSTGVLRVAQVSDGTGVIATVSTVTNLSQMNGAAITMGNGISGSGVQRVTLASDGTGVVGLIAGSAEIGNVKNSGTFAVQAAQSGTWTVQPGNTANTTAWKVDGSAVTQPVSGTVTATIAAGATTIAKAEDVASADADVGVPAMAIRKATPANTSGTDGDYEMLQVSAGRLWASATIDAALPAGTALIGKVGLDQTTPGTTNAVSLAQLGANTVATGNGASSTGVLRVAQVNDGTGVIATVSAVSNLVAMSGNAIAMNSGVRSAGAQRVTICTDDIVPASQSGTWTVQPGNTANTTPWLVSTRPATTGGLSKFHLVSAATTNATNVKASAGQVYSITAFNLNASARYLKFHNTAGTPTAGASVTDTYLIPGNTAGAGLVLNIDKGIAFSTGIGITLVTGIADADSAAVAASEIVLNIYYS
jgi:hypothetical protein